MTITANPKRKSHRRGPSLALGPTGARRTTAAALRQCCICRAARHQARLLQLGPIPDGAGPQESVAGAPRARPGRHSYVCVSHSCLRGAALRMAPKKGDAKGALAAFVAPLMQLATTRVIEAIGLARRQGLLVMGASRIIALRPKGGDLYFDEDDEDDDDRDDDHTPEGAALPPVASGPNPTDTVVDGGTAAHVDVFATAEPNGAQDVILLAADAAQRTARQLGPTARPCMLHGVAMGQAAGGAPVAAVGIPAGRLALQAAYWLQVWYEARAVLTPDAMMN